MIIVIGGVCGCGKSTIARQLADKLNCYFLEADDYHSESNRELMRLGVGLTDHQRLPWLRIIGGIMDEYHRSSQSVVVACSALRQVYRHFLNSGADFNAVGVAQSVARANSKQVLFIMLNYSPQVIEERICMRTGHDIIKDTKIVASQFAALELPPSTLDAESSPSNDSGSYLTSEQCDANSTEYSIYVLACNQSTTVGEIITRICTLLDVMAISQ